MTNLLWLTGEGLRGGQREPLAELDDFGAEVERFEESLCGLSSLLAEMKLEAEGLDERLLQGPVSDAISHAGQLTLLRRLAGSSVAPEDFFSADLTRVLATE